LQTPPLGTDTQRVPEVKTQSVDTEVADITTQSLGGNQLKFQQDEGPQDSVGLYSRWGDETGLTLKPGTRFGGMPVFRFSGDFDATSSNYVEKAREMSDPIHHPPGTVPVLRLQGTTTNDTAGELTYAKISMLDSNDSKIFELPTTQIGTAETPWWKEDYLGGGLAQNPTGDDRTHPIWTMEMKVTSGTGTVKGPIKGTVVWEVI